MIISKYALILSILLPFSVLNAIAQKGERKYLLDESKSSVNWSSTRGDENYSGKFKIKEGYVSFNDDELTQAVVFVNAQSLECKNCGDQESSKKMLEYARSAEFLNVQVMDFAVFKMYKSEKIENEDDYNYRIEGQLTIIAYAQTVSLPVVIEEKKGKISIEGKLSINRSLWHLENPSDGNPELYLDQTIDLYITLVGEKS